LLYLRERRGALAEAKVVFVGEPSNLCMSWLEAAAVLPYQIQVQHLDRLGPRGMFLPCPPVTRGEEVSAEAMRSPRCQNHAAKDNLLHVQNAIMETVAAAELESR
jgi:ornithine carbamoyltransferase